MKRIAIFVGLLLGVLAVVLPASATQPQAMRISSILYGQPDPDDPGNPNAFAISGCFAVTGAVTDEGGGPQFDASGNIVSCLGPEGIAGKARFHGLGHLKTGEPNVLRATHRMFGQRGEIDISFEGNFGPIVATGTPPDVRFLAETRPGNNWQITCGTRAYVGVQGVGTATAVADFTQAFAPTPGPVVVVHIDTGRVHLTGSGASGACSPRADPEQDRPAELGTGVGTDFDAPNRNLEGRKRDRNPASVRRGLIETDPHGR